MRKFLLFGFIFGLAIASYSYSEDSKPKKLSFKKILKGLNSPKIIEGSRPGEERENSIGMKLCWIPAGKFVMGSPEDEKGRIPKRKEWETQVNVELTQGFWIGKYEVTQKEFEELIGSNPSHFRDHGENRPVEQVDWQQAMEFCSKLTKKDRNKRILSKGWVYTLPTEAQWEYACRAGEKGPYSGGTLKEVAWFRGNAKETQRVGGKKANKWGVHDMHGNVLEWCSSWFGEELKSGRDPGGPATGTNRVYRGGGYLNPAEVCRAANRYGNLPFVHIPDLGFRILLSPSASVKKTKTP